MAKFSSLDEFYEFLPDDQRVGIRRLVDFVSTSYPQLDLVLAWNQPMFKIDGSYLIGFMPTQKHINLLTVTDTAITALASELAGFRHGTRSISLPFDWSIDAQFINRVLTLRSNELGVTL